MARGRHPRRYAVEGGRRAAGVLRALQAPQPEKTRWLVRHPLSGLTQEFASWSEAKGDARQLADYWREPVLIERLPSRAYRKGRRAAVVVRPRS